jgi:hypothetical protein
MKQSKASTHSNIVAYFTLKIANSEIYIAMPNLVDFLPEFLRDIALLVFD